MSGKRTHDFLLACERGDKRFVSGALQQQQQQQQQQQHQRGGDQGERRVDVDAQDEDGHTGLQVAAANDQRDVLRLLLSSGADPALGNSSGWTPLHHACLHGHSDAARALIDAAGAGAGAVHARNRFGATPLHVAAAGGHLSTVK